MVKGNLGRIAFVLGLVTAAGGAGCYLSEEDVENANDEVVAGADVSGVLKSTLILDQGCIATKVGPHHLLIAARCVAGKPEFAPGKKISFKVASSPNAVVTRDTDVAVGNRDGGATTAETDAGASSTDAGPRSDGGTESAPNTSTKEATISEVAINDSYKTKCPGQTCAFGTVAASDAKDIAVILLDADLEAIPTIPIDLDPVSPADPLIAVASGCKKLDGTPRETKTMKTVAVPPTSANHEGSPYKTEPQLTTRLNSAYVLTAGIGWRPNEIELCKNDIGAPLFRGAHAAVVGVTSNVTMFDKTSLVPVTVHHTRVDTISRVGNWLTSLGVETTKTCSESAEGCKTNTYDGGTPSSSRTDGTSTGSTEDEDDAGKPLKSDAGEDEEAEEQLPPRGDEEQLENGEDEYEQRFNDGEGYDAGPKKKKKKKASGCSAAPGTAPINPGGYAFAVGLAVAAAAARRRRR